MKQKKEKQTKKQKNKQIINNIKSWKTEINKTNKQMLIKGKEEKMLTSSINKKAKKVLEKRETMLRKWKLNSYQE